MRFLRNFIYMWLFLGRLCLFVILIPQLVEAQFHFQNLTEKIACEEGCKSQFRIDETVDANTAGYDLTFAEIHWKIDIVNAGIEGSITYHYTTLSDINFIEFDCSHVLEIDSIIYHGAPLENFTQDDWVLHITLPGTINEGTKDSIQIVYHGIPTLTGLGSFQDTTIIDTIAHTQDSLISTLSEPYGARDWWPCKMTLNDKIDSADISITVPVEYKAGTSGLLKDIDTTGNLATYHWETRYPTAPYLIGIAAFPYIERNHTTTVNGKDIFIQNFIFPSSEQELQDFLPNLDTIFQVFTDYYGEYPFINEKYGHAQWEPINGGMEHQTMSFVSDFGFELISHELAHQWFGDKITCASWQDIWLNEGFATYSTGLCFEHMAHGFWFKPFRATNLGRAIADSSGSVFVDDTTNIGRIFSPFNTYAKGFYLLTMLRWKLGDDIFFPAIKNYITDPQLSYGFATTANFKQHLENVYVSSLDEFFNDWYYGKGFPSYHYYWQQSGDTITSYMYQTQSDPSSPFFHIPIPLKFFGGGKDTTIVIEPQSNGEQFILRIPFKVDSVFIDPELWTVSGHNTVINGLLNIETPAGKDGIVLFPNPAADELNVHHTLIGETIEELVITDKLGRIVWHEDNLHLKPFEISHIDISAISNGAYVLTFKGKHNVYTNSILKLKP